MEKEPEDQDSVESTKPYESEKSTESTFKIDFEESPDNYTRTLNDKDVLQVIGDFAEDVQETTELVTNNGYMSPDLESPKELRRFNVKVLLPDDHDIDTELSLCSKPQVLSDCITSLSDSDSETDKLEQVSSIVLSKRRKSNPNSRLGLLSNFAPEALPLRILTRIRNPSEKLKETLSTKNTRSILQPIYLIGQDEIDDNGAELVKCNIIKFKTLMAKKLNKTSINSEVDNIIPKSDNRGINIDKKAGNKGNRAAKSQPTVLKYGANNKKRSKSKLSNTKNLKQDPKNHFPLRITRFKTKSISTTNKDENTITNNRKDNNLGLIKLCEDTKTTNSTRYAKRNKIDQKTTTANRKAGLQFKRKYETRNSAKLETNIIRTKAIKRRKIKMRHAKLAARGVRRSKRMKTKRAI